MVKPITEYTKEELEEKIVKIKAERERTAEALKKYEEELEHRKREVPLGVPVETQTDPEKRLFYLNLSCFLVDGCNYIDKESPFFKNLCLFHSRESAQKHSEMLLAWRKALVANAKGEQIDIKVLLPLLPKGWVATDAFGVWRWYQEKPDLGLCEWKNYGVIPSERLSAFNLKRADDWRESLMECGL